MFDPLISIIVPVFNVEKYLKKCIESLINQTYSKLEIIIVNDGSTDNSLKICKQYAKVDGRLTIISIPNQGQAAARNRGLDICHGEYILFVDSDDFLELSSCKELIDIAMRTDADIISFRERKYDCRNDNHHFLPCEVESRKELIMSCYDAGKQYIHGLYFQNAVWSRLYKRYICDAVRFPEGFLGEDYAVSYLQISQAKKVVFYDRCLYCYRIRNSSTMTSNNIKLVIDVYHIHCKKYAFEKKKYPEEISSIETDYANRLLKTNARLINEKSQDYINLINEIDAKIHKLNCSVLPISTRVTRRIYLINKKVFAFVMKKIGKNG